MKEPKPRTNPWWPGKSYTRT